MSTKLPFLILISLILIVSINAYSVFAVSTECQIIECKASPCDSYGDLNSDGYVTNADITAIESCILGLGCTAEQKLRADVNNDGNVNMGDVTKLERYILGIDDTFPICYTCGDGICDYNENGISCPDDCYTPGPPICTSSAWSCSAWEPEPCPESEEQTRTCTLIDETCSNPNDVKPSETQSCTYEPPINTPPEITEFTFPATANKNTDITVKVTATDTDGIDRIEILENGNLQTQSCNNIVECTKEFIIHLPDAFDTVYTIVARAFDKLGAFTTQTKSGKTNPYPSGTCTSSAWSCNIWQPNVCPQSGYRTRTCALIDTTCLNPNAVKPSKTQSCTPSEEIEEEERINTKISSDDLLISSIIPDSEYVAPGDEILLYVSIKNEGESRFKNLQITAIVKELGIKAVSSPFTLKERSTVSKTLFFDVPSDAEPGIYYIKIEVASDSDHTARYRIFEVY